jgi:hypothetical protein
MASAVNLPNGRTQFAVNGVPLSGGLVFHYIPGSFSAKVTWADPGEVTANDNPIVLDANGSWPIFGDGQYRQILQDALGNQIWDQVTVALGSTAILAAIPNFTGDTGAGGQAGFVPAPPAGSAAVKKYLGADGTFDSLSVVVPAAPPANQAGFLFVPQRLQTATTDAIVLTDAGGNVAYDNASAGSLFVSNDTNVNWVGGVVTQVMITNFPASGILTLTPDSGVTLTWPGNTATSGDRLLAPNGQALLSRIASNTWTVVGAGLS